MTVGDKKIGENLVRFKMGVNSHDRENDGKAWGIGLCLFDMERLGFEEAEELWAGITVHQDQGGTGNFRVLCDCQGHGENNELTTETAQEDLRVVGVEA